ncbi:UNVERIFIED_CONTAM: hypothetical protein NCL1_23165 [Trichonephila clavipes]
MPNEKPAKYEIHFRFVSNIVWQGTRPFDAFLRLRICQLHIVICSRVVKIRNFTETCSAKKWFSPVLHENGEASCRVGEGVMICSRGRQPMALGIVVKFVFFFLIANILALVTSGKNGFYRLGTSEGILKEVYENSQITLCHKNLLRIKDIPDHEIPHLSVAIAHFNGGDAYYLCFVKCFELFNLIFSQNFIQGDDQITNINHGP